MRVNFKAMALETHGVLMDGNYGTGKGCVFGMFKYKAKIGEGVSSSVFTIAHWESLYRLITTCAISDLGNSDKQKMLQIIKILTELAIISNRVGIERTCELISKVFDKRQLCQSLASHSSRHGFVKTSQEIMHFIRCMS